MVETHVMSQSTGIFFVRWTGRFNGFCRILFELGLLFAVVTLALIPLHASQTRHANVIGIVDDQHFTVKLADRDHLNPSGDLPIYRFNPNWQEPIGNAFVDRQDGDIVTFRYDPSTFQWPLGRQGVVLNCQSKEVTVNLGSAVHLKTGDRLNLFQQRHHVGKIQLTDVGPIESKGQIIAYFQPTYTPSDLGGLTVSEFEVATQVVYSHSPALDTVEWFAYPMVLGGYLWCRRKPIRLKMKPLPSRFKKVLSCALELGLSWPIAQFLVRSVAHVLSIVQQDIFHQSSNELQFQASLEPFVLVLFALSTLIIGTRLVSQGSSLHQKIWDAFKFGGGVFRHSASALPEHLTMFFFQLIIVFAFGRTLGAFFQENCRQGIMAVWPHAPQVVSDGVEPVSLEGFGRSIQAIGYALTHNLETTQPENLFLFLQTAVYNICIAGCLVGYGYSLLGYLWGKKVRNVDFTLVGWLTNAVCYGPLLGVVLWQMVPPTVGSDPIVAHGSLHLILMIVSFSLNVVYTMTIWNLGTMFGVMTDKGVRSTGFYSVVRHPSYTLEALMFVVTYCRGLSSSAQWYAVSFFFLIYWLRSEREDQFMSISNPDYRLYKQKTTWKFIPGIY